MVDYTNPAERFKLLLIKKQDNVTPLPIAKPRAKKAKTAPLNVDWGKVNAVVETPVTTVTVAETKPDPTATPSDKLEGLLDKALKTYEEILDLKTNPMDEDFTAIMRLKASACEKIIGTQTKVDENRLRARNDSRLGDILERLTEAKKRLNLTVNVS